jgi:hypothetical protein
MMLTKHLHLMPRVKIGGATFPLSLFAFMEWTCKSLWYVVIHSVNAVLGTVLSRMLTIRSRCKLVRYEMYT